jgi:hypothetical protein
MVTKNDRIKCDECGKIMSFKKPMKQDFIPDTKFTTEQYFHYHIKCQKEGI